MCLLPADSDGGHLISIRARKNTIIKRVQTKLVAQVAIIWSKISVN